MPFIKEVDGTLIVSDRSLVLGNTEFLRTDDGTAIMNIDGTPSGAATVLWNGTGAGDTGGDWTLSDDGTETAGSMRTGTNGLDSGVRGNNDKSTFTDASSSDVDSLYDTISFWMNPQLKETNTTLSVRFFLAGGSIGAKLDVANYVTNFDLGIWQKVTIPIADFGLTGVVDNFKFLYEAQGPKDQQYFFDDIEFTAAGGGGPFTFQVAAPDANTQYHLSMLVFMASAPAAGWNATTFIDQTALTSGLLIRHRKISTAEVLWSFNAKDNTDLFGRFHPQDDITFADGTLLMGFMVKPGKASVVVTDDEVLEFIVRDNLSGITSARAYAHYGAEDTTPP